MNNVDELIATSLSLGMTLVIIGGAIIIEIVILNSIAYKISENKHGLYMELGMVCLSIIACVIINSFCSVSKNVSLLLKFWIVINCCVLPLLASGEFKRY